MTETTEALVRSYLTRIDQRLDAMAFDLKNLKVRADAIDQGVVLVAGQLDCVAARLSRVAQRLDVINRNVS